MLRIPLPWPCLHLPTTRHKSARSIRNSPKMQTAYRWFALFDFRLHENSSTSPSFFFLSTIGIGKKGKVSLKLQRGRRQVRLRRGGSEGFMQFICNIETHGSGLIFPSIAFKLSHRSRVSHLLHARYSQFR